MIPTVPAARLCTTLASLVAAAVLAFALFQWSGSATQPFEPTEDVVVSPNTPGVRAAFAVNSSLPAGNHRLRSLVVVVPNGWAISDAPNFDTVGSGTITLDIDCDGSPNTFNFTLEDRQPPAGDELTSWYASIPGFMDIQFRIKAIGTGGYTISVTFPWNFFPGIVACTPETFNWTTNVNSSPSNFPVMTNPSSAGPYNFQLTYGSDPFPPQHTVVLFDCVVIGSGACPTPTPTATPGGDSDGDGVPDTTDNCPTISNPGQENINPGDAVGDACDPDDFDLDTFSDRIEYFVATDRGAPCAANPSHNAWPADINNDRFSDITDRGAVASSFGLAVPPAPARHNIAPDPPDGFVDVTDTGRIATHFGQGC